MISNLTAGFVYRFKVSFSCDNAPASILLHLVLVRYVQEQVLDMETSLPL